MTRLKRRYNWIPDAPDARDQVLRMPLRREIKLFPPAIDNRLGFPLAPFDQGDEGSCTANAGVAAYLYVRKAQKERCTLLSRQFLYWVSHPRPGGDNG